MKTRQDYRNDIDGLRAIAVLLVVVFHINEKLIPGGFIGVDMFFVISGYVITWAIIKGYGSGEFSFADFYRKRIKRILPAMFFVTAVTLAAGVALMLPEDVEALSWSAVATVLSGANIYFTYFLDTSYFASDSRAIPLLHMWSLGVEEQFYIFWPAFLLTILRWPRFVIPALLALIALSILVGELQLHQGFYSWAYYMLPARAFELAAGGLLIYAQKGEQPQLHKGIAFSAAVLGLLLIGLSAAFLTGESPFPGLLAIPVTLGTVLLLASGSTAQPISSILSLPPIRWVGLISYSLYLWHWPVLAYAHYMFGEISVTQQLACAALMLCLSILSYYSVEKPARFSEKPFRSLAIRYFSVPTAAMVIVASALIITKGFGPWLLTKYPEQLAQFSTDIRPAGDMDYVCQTSTLSKKDTENPKCIINGTSEPKILLWGDSNASHYVGALAALSREAGISFRNFAHSACPSVLDRPERFTREKIAKACKSSSATALKEFDKYDTIIMSSSWDTYLRQNEAEFTQALAKTIETLKTKNKKIIVLGQVPRLYGYDPTCERKNIKLKVLHCRDAFKGAPQRIETTNQIVKKVASEKGVGYLDFEPILCSRDFCGSKIAEKSIYYDSGHLSGAGSERLGTAASKHGGFMSDFIKIMNITMQSGS
ncbi:acyltransferase family protein [Nitratireductor indicus]|uniref:acyltransferase family protein n=1 Tax=Nitratireductor indicus TaxID=721133 RepID=UPI0028764D7B|nr:acyltransferase family protein [Nitratireductor indicus]MDS1136005.1 acyltransferase family protein [Nitratireductor indicus]